MAVHLIFSSQGLRACLKRRQPQDPVIFLGDGVYAYPQWLEDGLPADLAKLLVPDAKARGMDTQSVPIGAIGYSAMVDITDKHSPVVSWKD